MSNIKLNEKTVSALVKLFAVDQSIRIPANSKTLRVKSQNNTMMARVEIPDEFERDVHIYDTREFISVMNIVTDPELDFSNSKFVTIHSADGKQKLRYLEAEPSLIQSYIDKDLVLPSVDLEVTVTEQQLASILTAAQTMKLEYVGLVGDGETLTLSAFNKNNGDNNETNNFTIDLGTTEDTFRMQYKLDIHNITVLLKEGDLKIQICAKNKISQIDTQTGKTFWIALDAKSTWG